VTNEITLYGKEEFESRFPAGSNGIVTPNSEELLRLVESVRAYMNMLDVVKEGEDYDKQKYAAQLKLGNHIEQELWAHEYKQLEGLCTNQERVENANWAVEQMRDYFYPKMIGALSGQFVGRANL
jgi:hypothetical protein